MKNHGSLLEMSYELCDCTGIIVMVVSCPYMIIYMISSNAIILLCTPKSCYTCYTSKVPYENNNNKKESSIIPIEVPKGQRSPGCW